VWRSKYNMKVFDGQRIMHQIIDPEGLFGCLAFGAMPVATTVVAIAYGTTSITSLLVSAKGSRAATYNAAQHFYLPCIQFFRNRECIAKLPYHIGQFKLCPHAA
jgi:hypothetical protein